MTGEPSPPVLAVEERLAQAFLEAHPLDAAPVLEGCDSGDAAAVLAGAPPAAAAGTLQRMARASAAECLARMAPAAAAAVVDALALDEAALLLRWVGADGAQAILAALPEDVAGPLRATLRFPERTAGAVMDPRVLSLPEDLTVQEALRRVRAAPRHVLYYLHVVERAGRLTGVLNLRELMLAPPEAPLAAVARPALARLNARDGWRAVVVHPGWRALHAMPVVDEGGVFLGAIRYETVRRLEGDVETTLAPRPGLGTVLGLAELCWIGMTGILAALAGAPSQRPSGTPDAREGRR